MYEIKKYIIQVYLGSSTGLGLLDVIRPEEELSVKVGFLNEVHVGDGDLAGACAHANHGEVLQELATDGTSTCSVVSNDFRLYLKLTHPTPHILLAQLPRS
jgi:hypothetical protein